MIFRQRIPYYDQIGFPVNPHVTSPNSRFPTKGIISWYCNRNINGFGPELVSAACCGDVLWRTFDFRWMNKLFKTVATWCFPPVPWQGVADDGKTFEVN